MALAGAVTSVGMIALASYLDPRLRADFGPEVIIWVLATALATSATIPLGSGRPSLSMDLPVLLACAFVMGPIYASIIALVSVTTIDEWRGDIAVSKIAWNHSQTSLSVLVAGYVFLWSGGELGRWPQALVAAVAALAADAVVNFLSVALLTSVSERRRFSVVLREMRVGSPVQFGLFYTAFALIGLLIAETYARLGPMALMAAIAPIVLARQVFVSTHLLDRLGRQLSARAAALMRVDARIAEERRDERSRIAEALHDDVLQALYTVTLHAHVVRQDYQTGRLLDLEKDVPAVVDAAEKASSMLRDVIFNARRSSVGHAGLVETARLFIAYTQAENQLTIEADLDPAVSAEAAVELLIYQVLREALTNTARHSCADRAWVTLRRERSVVYLSVQDNGQGFDLNQQRDLRHFGLDLMRERAEATGGSFEIRSRPDGGTCIEAWFQPTLRPV